MTEIKIRPATLEDLPILLEFEQGIISFERPYDPTLADDPISYYNIKAMIGSEDAEVVVAVSENEIVGSAYAKVEEAKDYFKFEKIAYLGFMFVKPEFRGRGINKKIIESLRQWSISKNLNEMQLQVYQENESAVRAYEKAGFKKHMMRMRIGI